MFKKQQGGHCGWKRTHKSENNERGGQSRLMGGAEHNVEPLKPL